MLVTFSPPPWGRGEQKCQRTMSACLDLRHAADQARREGRQRRGGGQHIEVADLLERSDADLDDLVGSSPDPATTSGKSCSCSWTATTFPKLPGSWAAV